MDEIETKILEVDPKSISEKLDSLGAELILDTKFAVDWFRTKDSQEGDDQWFLRIRTTAQGKSEVTWKGFSTVLGDSRRHKEISFEIAEPKKMGDLFLNIGLEKYAHQDKLRKSWQLKDWRFDLDTYPNMPSYLEIEGKSEAHIQEAIQSLALVNHKKSSGGERILIQEKYGLDWYNMHF